VDNGSTDGALDGLESLWPELTLHVVRLIKNKGFAAANNIGARHEVVHNHYKTTRNTKPVQSENC
jgi:GT2 family glycosyltransferase